MPFISIDQKELQKALITCNQISPKRSDIDLFTYIRCDIVAQTITISAISQAIYYKTQLPLSQSDIESPLSFLIKTDMLASAVAVIKDEQIGIQIDTSKTSIIVQGAKAKHSLRINLDNLTEFQPNYTNESQDIVSDVQVETASMIEASKLALATVGQPKNVYQPQFLSICITHRPEISKIAIASSDKYRISRTLIPATFQVSPEINETSLNHLINPKPLSLLLQSLHGVESMRMQFFSSFVKVTEGATEFVLRYGEGVFPEYERIIPQSFACSFLLDAKEMTEALRQVQFTARTNVINKTLHMNVFPSQSKLVLTAKSDDGYSSEAELQMQSYQGVDEDWNQAFNADYLMDYTSLVHTLNVFVEANPGKPMVMSPENAKDTQLCLIQGLR